MQASPAPRLRELADFIRVRRDQLSPELCGLDSGAGRRRAPGLRWDELGKLAGLVLQPGFTGAPLRSPAPVCPVGALLVASAPGLCISVGAGPRSS